MELLITILLIIHITAGITCFVSGCIAIIATKGKSVHRISGKTYFIGMFTVIITAVIVATYRDNLFLLLIASFSFYMAWAGVQSVRHKDLKPRILDWFFLIVAAVTAVTMILTLNIVLLIFGILFSVNIIQELLLFISTKSGKTPNPKAWLIRHIGMMLGSFIATVTAFLVTNFQSFDPQWLPWIAPTIVGSPLIAFYIRKVKTKGL